MSYVIQAVLSNAQHPEYGQVTIPFPIPNQNYDCTIELLEPLEIGDTLRQDCQVDELDSFYTVLNALIGTQVTLDELDYLAKRLDSFDDGEAAQFQGMAHKLGLSKIKDLINLTFCCQKATVITDFSDLEKIGREHYMNLNGGCARTEDLEALDGTETAYLLIDSGAGTVTPYPPYGEAQARELIDCLREVAPYVVIDCGSYIANDILSAVALMEADSVLRLANADLKSISYLSSQLPLLKDAKWDTDKQYKIAANVKPQQAGEQIGQALGNVAFTLSHSEELEAQFLAGILLSDLTMKESRGFRKEIEQVCREVFSC